MLSKDSLFHRWYFNLYQFVASKRLQRNDLDPRVIHTQIAVVLTTGVLMWAYALLACFTISSAVPGVIGLICALTHALSPLLFRVTNKSNIVANVLLTAGIIHQATFAFHAGGFHSNIIIWFGILPMLGGVINGRKGAITWLYITLLASTIFLILEIIDYNFPTLISPFGKFLSQALLIFGWIFISATVVIVYASLRETTERELKNKGQKVDDLFRVLFHDLANPMGRISIGLSIAKKTMPDAENNRGLEIARVASDSMMEITQNIRKMYAVSKGKANVDLVPSPLNAAVEYVQDIYKAELAKKNLRINYDFKKFKDLNLLVEPVSFNNQVLGNIISNAIKFSKENGQITVQVIPMTQNLFKLEIKDNGVGIPVSLLPYLFDLGKKTSRPGTNGELGTGFGMHIMKSFVEMYSGEVIVDSQEEGKGSQSGTTIKLILKGEWK